MIGKILNGRYEIIEEIGKGGMAYVYKARCVLLNRLVAIKILRDDLDGGEEFLDRFNAEAQAAASLDHPNIVSIFDVGMDDNRHYITMEYVDGQTLKEYIAQKGNLNYKEALNIAWQIADALTAAHSKNIVHRDIKPHNILITSDGTVKVTDFGIARFGTGKTLSIDNNILGSVHYISPEQAKGLPVDNRSDIYSLGVVLYEMLTGEVPFDSDNPVSVAMMQIENSPAEITNYVSNVPVSSQHIVFKAMTKDPDLRYQTADELKNDILSVLKDPTVIIDKRFLYKNLNPEPETKIVTHEVEEVQTKTATKVSMIILAAITSFVIVLGGYLVTKILTNNPGDIIKDVINPGSKDIKIPSLVDKNIDEAKKLCEEAGLTLVVDDEIEDDSKLPGTVISQSPAAGEKVGSDKTVRVIIAKEFEYFELEDYTGENFEDVQKKLLNLDLQVNIKFEETEDDEEGKIIKHVPKGGQKVKAGDIITLYVSEIENEDDKLIEVPDLVGKTYAEAKSILGDSELLVGDIMGKDDPADDDVIIAQSIPSGSRVAKKCKVSLTFEKDKEETSKEDESNDIKTDNKKNNGSTQTQSQVESEGKTQTQEQTNTQTPAPPTTVAPEAPAVAAPTAPPITTAPQTSGETSGTAGVQGTTEVTPYE